MRPGVFALLAYGFGGVVLVLCGWLRHRMWKGVLG